MPKRPPKEFDEIGLIAAMALWGRSVFPKETKEMIETVEISKPDDIPADVWVRAINRMPVNQRDLQYAVEDMAREMMNGKEAYDLAQSMLSKSEEEWDMLEAWITPQDVKKLARAVLGK